MTAAKVCAKCQRPIPGDAPDGACPNCLFAAAFDTGTGAGGATDAEPSPDELAPLFPGLTIESVLGRGGMGVVYKARHKALDRDVALKVLPAGLAGDAAFAERFQREARALAKLQHPNIVAVHDFGQTEGLCWLVMEFVDGTNIRQAMAAKAIGPKEALAIVPQICDALQYAHEHGVVHRDIKPENVLLDKSGRVKVADFGLAKLMASGDADRTLTGAGQVMGTPHYMAPEQWERPKDVDHRADIYSLGVVFYEMLTGELPVGRFAAPSTKSAVDARIDDIVLRTLERERELRYQQVAQVKTDMGKAGKTARRPVVERKRWREFLPLSPAELATHDRFREAIVGVFLLLSGLNAWLSAGRPAYLLVPPALAACLIGVSAFWGPREPAEADTSIAAWRRRRRWAYSVVAAGIVLMTVWAFVPPGTLTASIEAASLAFWSAIFLMGLVRRWNMAVLVLGLLLVGLVQTLAWNFVRPNWKLLSTGAAAQLGPDDFRAESGKQGPAIDIPTDVRMRIDALWRAAQRLPPSASLDEVAELYSPEALTKFRAMTSEERARQAADGQCGVPLLPRDVLTRPLAEFRLETVEFIELEDEMYMTPRIATGTASADGVSIRFRFQQEGRITDEAKSVYGPWYFGTWARVDR